MEIGAHCRGLLQFAARGAIVDCSIGLGRSSAGSWCSCLGCWRHSSGRFCVLKRQHSLPSALCTWVRKTVPGPITGWTHQPWSQFPHDLPHRRQSNGKSMDGCDCLGAEWTIIKTRRELIAIPLLRPCYVTQLLMGGEEGCPVKKCVNKS